MQPIEFKKKDVIGPYSVWPREPGKTTSSNRKE